MKNFIVGLVIAATTTFTAAASDLQVFFPSVKMSDWEVVGTYLPGTTPTAFCQLRRIYNNGGVFFMKDMTDGELFINMSYDKWNISDKPNTIIQTRVFITKHNGQKITFNGELVVLDYNRLQLRDAADKFIEALKTAKTVNVSPNRRDIDDLVFHKPIQRELNVLWTRMAQCEETFNPAKHLKQTPDKKEERKV